ncbi:MAG: glucose-1-phosphate adenylyltransferase subunit GlgD [Lachnospiraceae bacterium]|nr:glucose-1-phosphate adenylyltransferase subunit GlgD [Lachnospiraceae bacterium]
MLKSKADALGIIMPNSYDGMVAELVKERLMASIPFAGNYRVIDFLLSGMVNGGIDHIFLVVKQNYHSLMMHIGSGREWTRTGKSSGIQLVPPFSNKGAKLYTGRVEAIYCMLPYLREMREKYVVVSDANLVVNFDFQDLIARHIESGADVTVVYRKTLIPRDFKSLAVDDKNLYYTWEVDGDRVTGMRINSKEDGIQNFSMNIYVLEKEMLIRQINEAQLNGSVYYERDVLSKCLDKLDVRAYCYDGYVAQIGSMRSYFEENMRLLEEQNERALFAPGDIYSKTCDEHPTRYLCDARAKRLIAADGGVIEGEVENSILFCGVKIGKGAKVKNCILMNDTVVGEGARLEYVVADKKVVVSAGTELKGTDTFPVYLEKRKEL